jgi:DNA-binding transcriptional regulator YdaS (Cro superfamily)
MSNLAELLRHRGKTLSDLARALQVHKATVSRWNEKGVPHERVAQVEEKTGIPACDIRPDVALVYLRKGVVQ